MIRHLRPFAGLLVLALIAVSACDNKTTTPTPAPAPTPPPTTPPPPPPPPPPPAAPAALESLTLSESTVPSQSRPTATIRLTAPAPAGNAAIFLETTNTDVAKVPANISIAAGETTTSFAIETSTVRSATQVTIEARYLGVAARAVLTVVPPGLNANFRVVSPTRGDDVCPITTGAGGVDCVFDASLSTGIVSTYRWTLAAAGKELTFNLADGEAAFTPATTCSFLGGGTLNSDGVLPMVVTLRLQDRSGNVSNPFQKNISVAPNGNCGY